SSSLHLCILIFFYLMNPHPPRPTLFPYTTLFRSRGRLERSTIPASPSARYRSTQRRAVVTETPNRSAARRSGVLNDASGQTQTTGRGQRGVSVGHEDLRVFQAWFLDSTTPHSEVFLMSRRHPGLVPNLRGQYT